MESSPLTRCWFSASDPRRRRRRRRRGARHGATTVRSCTSCARRKSRWSRPVSWRTTPPPKTKRVRCVPPARPAVVHRRRTPGPMSMADGAARRSPRCTSASPHVQPQYHPQYVAAQPLACPRVLLNANGPIPNQPLCSALDGCAARARGLRPARASSPTLTSPRHPRHAR